MSVTKCLFAGLAASLVMCATAVATYATDEGLICPFRKFHPELNWRSEAESVHHSN